MDYFFDTIFRRNTRDRLFRFIFGSEKRKKWTLSLYNAIYNTDYTDADELTLTTINDGIISVCGHNDFDRTSESSYTQHNNQDAVLHGPDLQQLPERHKSDKEVIQHE